MLTKDEKIDRSQACLMLGAVGDALGAAVEFLGDNEITERFGPQGIQYPDVYYRVKGPITDDTQMTLFCADGLINAFIRGCERGILAGYWNYTAMSYKRWLATQGISQVNENTWWGSEELFEIIKAQGQRGPGNTCVSALRVKKNSEFATNDSKGCGTVMRIAPIGIFFGNLINGKNIRLERVYETGANDAAITHGHEIAKNSSGVLAVIIASIMLGENLLSSTQMAISKFSEGKVSDLCSKAVKLANDAPSKENLTSLGQGWIAEEALAMSIYCSLLAVSGSLSIEDSLRLAVNHRGDSDSIGAITGNLIGVSLGSDSIPRPMIKDTEVETLEPLIKSYGERLITIEDYEPSYMRTGFS